MSNALHIRLTKIVIVLIVFSLLGTHQDDPLQAFQNISGQFQHFFHTGSPNWMLYCKAFLCYSADKGNLKMG